MILLTFSALLFMLDTAYDAWQAGMRQAGIAIAACSIPSFGGALFSDTSPLFLPIAGALGLCVLAIVQMQKFIAGPYRNRGADRTS